MSACPACGEPLYAWLLVRSGKNGSAGDSLLLERCERCRLGVAASLAPANSTSALLGFAQRLSDGRVELRVANRASVQASLGGSHWAALEPQRRLYPTPESLPPLAAARDAPSLVDAALAAYDLRAAAAAVWRVVEEGNRYVERVRPWELARSGSPTLDAVLGTLLATCRALGELLAPFLPDAAARIVAQCTPDPSGRLPAPEPLFPRR